MKGHKGYHHTHGTEGKIEAHVRKHRATGGLTVKGKGKESPMSGKDEATEDLKSKPEEYNKGKPEKEAKEKKVVEAEGEGSKKHAGRKPRASGGGCEANPFTHANKGTGPTGRKFERETEGRDA